MLALKIAYSKPGLDTIGIKKSIETINEALPKTSTALASDSELQLSEKDLLKLQLKLFQKANQVALQKQTWLRQNRAVKTLEEKLALYAKLIELLKDFSLIPIDQKEVKQEIDALKQQEKSLENQSDTNQKKIRTEFINKRKPPLIVIDQLLTQKVTGSGKSVSAICAEVIRKIEANENKLDTVSTLQQIAQAGQSYFDTKSMIQSLYRDFQANSLEKLEEQHFQKNQTETIKRLVNDQIRQIEGNSGDDQSRLLCLESGLESLVKQAKKHSYNITNPGAFKTLISKNKWKIEIQRGASQTAQKQLEDRYFYDIKLDRTIEQGTYKTFIGERPSLSKYFMQLGWGSALVLRKLKEDDKDAKKQSSYAPYQLYTVKGVIDKLITSRGKMSAKKIGFTAQSREGRPFKATSWGTEKKLIKPSRFKRYQFARYYPLDKLMTYQVSSCSVCLIKPQTPPGQDPPYLIFSHINNNCQIPIRSILRDLQTNEKLYNEDKRLLPLNLNAPLEIIASIYPTILEWSKYHLDNLIPKTYKAKIVPLLRESNLEAVYPGDRQEALVHFQTHDAIGLHFNPSEPPCLVGDYGPANINAYLDARGGFFQICRMEYALDADDDLRQKLRQGQMDEAKVGEEMRLRLFQAFISGKMGAGQINRAILDKLARDRRQKAFSDLALGEQQSLFQELIIPALTLKSQSRKAFDEYVQNFGAAIEEGLLKNRVVFKCSLNGFDELSALSYALDSSSLTKLLPSNFQDANVASNFNSLARLNRPPETAKKVKTKSWFNFA